MGYLVNFLNIIIELVILLVIVHTALSYFVAPDHPVRVLTTKMIEPLLKPIRKFMPQTGSVDFSPMVLILILIVVQYILTAIFRSF